MVSKVAVAALTACIIVPCVSQQQEPTSVAAYHDGEPTSVRFAAPAKGNVVRVGPWKLGARLKSTTRGRPDKISDKRINLYFIVPGTQHQSKAAPAFDHNLIVNTVPASDDPLETEADLFWVAILDPTLNADIKGETDLIMLAQQRFTPNDLFAVDDMPSIGFLREVAHVDELMDLKRYRQKDGTMPRILIIPANAIFSVTVTAP